ncbi:MAG: PstS family phosphate ABC transporter substrate-binding protein [Planctomycetota bacterium]
MSLLPNTGSQRSPEISGMSSNFSSKLALALLSGLLFVGCDGAVSDSESEIAGDDGGAVSNLTGSIKIDGSSTVLPISNAVAETFRATYPNVEVIVYGAGTGNGFKEFYAKSTDISDASRPIKPGELQSCNENGVEFVELPIAYDGLTIVVNPKNDWAETLTLDQLKKIFVGENAAKKWSDVDPSWPDKAINIYAPGTGSGTYDYFHEVVIGKSEEDLRSDMSLNEDDNVLVNGVSDNEFSIGFFGVAYYNESKDSLKAVQIVNPEDGEKYLPTNENIASGKYAPFSRPLFIYVSLASMGRAEVATFVDYYLDNVSDLCEEVGYVKLPSEIIEKGRANLDSELVGTHFVKTDGSSRSSAEEPLAEIFVPENLYK